MPDLTTRIAYLTYDGLTDSLGQSQILPYIIGLEKRGYEFVIFSFEKKDAFQTGRTKVNELLEGKKIKWYPLAYHKFPPVISTLVDIVVLNKALLYAWKKTPFQIIHCRSYITALVGLKLKRTKKAKFIFDMRGFWADERVEGGLWNLSNALYRNIYRFFKKKEVQFLTEADYVVSLTENAKREILSWDISPAPISVIPTCVDLEFFSPQNINQQEKIALRAKLEITPDAFVLLYLGSWGTWYLTDDMLNFFVSVKELKPQAVFLIVTPDEVILPTALKPFVRVTHASREMVPLFISVSNGAIAFIKPSFSKKASSATKLAEILAMQVPVVTNAGWGDTDLMQTLGVKVIPTLSADILQKGAQYLIGSGDGLFGTNFTMHHVSLSTGIGRYSEIYKALLFT